jgi:hypothetical protein
MMAPPVDEFSTYRDNHRLQLQHHHHQQQQHRRPGGDQSHDVADPENPRRVTFVEGTPRKMRCVATGGFPLPEMQILVGSRDVTRDFSLSHSVTLDGIQGLRAISYLTERTTDKIVFAARDDGLPIRCVVTVPGLTPNQTQVYVNVLCKTSADFTFFYELRLEFPVIR